MKQKTLKKWSNWHKWALGLLAGVLLAAFLIVESSPASNKELIEGQFSIIDGKHEKLTELIKAELSEPGSFKHLQTSYSIIDSVVFVSEQFTFNDSGTPTNGTAKAYFSTAGQLIGNIEIKTDRKTDRN